jgi:hypothetical protein
VYRRADLWRTFVLVVALLLTAVSTGAFAREFRIPDLQNERHPVASFHSRRLGVEQEALNRTNVALIRTMAPLLVRRLRGVEQI